MDETNFKLNALFFRRVIMLLGMMYPRWTSITVPLTIFVLLVSILNEMLTYYVGVLPSEYFVVLTGRDRIGFNGLVVKRLFFSYRDQRITQDVEKTCRLFSDIFCRLVMAPFIIIYYSYQTYASTGYLGPLTIYAYFILATIVNKMAMSPVVRNVVKQEKKEGDFRFKHVGLRTHSEAIAFYHSSSLEKLLTNEELENLLKVQQKLMNWRFQLNFMTNLSDYFGGFLSYLILSVPVFFLGTYDHVPPAELSGLISRNAFYYLYLINSFSTLINLAQTFSDIAGTTHR
ncbi:unnamed protein product [Soboliphyme baturini]|uniref:ABC transmembrane type-1 domain-containing protein n=1 Tax=Soboliphyme baturini TaxID=241478 RepID=A0A183J275_9BILA|nr:unnamed protein product [Soboliphyme baturini]